MDNSGNQPPLKASEFRKALREAVSGDDVQSLAKKLMEQARLGDVPSARLLLSTLVPKQSFEDAVTERLEAWKAKFLDELICRVDLASLRQKIVGYHASPSEETSALLELLGSLESFSEAA